MLTPECFAPKGDVEARHHCTDGASLMNCPAVVSNSSSMVDKPYFLPVPPQTWHFPEPAHCLQGSPTELAPPPLHCLHFPVPPHGLHSGIKFSPLDLKIRRPLDHRPDKQKKPDGWVDAAASVGTDLERSGLYHRSWWVTIGHYHLAVSDVVCPVRKADE